MIPDCFEYHKNFLTEKESNELYNYLVNNLDWEEREITIFGKTYLQPRLVKWFGDKDYTYSNSLMKKSPLPEILEKIKNKIEAKTNSKFNSVLLNYYRNGQDSMGKHSDDEKELGVKPVIASLSLGTQRDFIIRSKFDLKLYKISLENGSLLIMKSDSQKCYTHELPKRAKIKSGRINLTFRHIK